MVHPRLVRSLTTALAAALVATGTGFVHAPASGHTGAVAAPGNAEEFDLLKAWTVSVTVTERLTGGGYDETTISTYDDVSSRSFAASWSASRTGSARFPCPGGGGSNGYDIDGAGSGAAAELRPAATYLTPVDWGLDMPVWTVLGSFTEEDFSLSGMTYVCGGDPYYNEAGSQRPSTALVYLPGTVEELRAAPVGTEHAHSYSRTVGTASPESSRLTTTISYVARKQEAQFTDSCDDPGVVRHRSTVEGTGRVVAKALPDPDLGTVTLGVTWCLTDAGARIDRRSGPHGWASVTDNWVFLSALETAGFTLEHTTPDVTATLRSAQVRSNYVFGFDLDTLATAFAGSKVVMVLAKRLRVTAKGIAALQKKVKKARTKYERKRAKASLKRYKRDMAKEIRRKGNAAVDAQAAKLRKRMRKAVAKAPLGRKKLIKLGNTGIDRSAAAAKRAVKRLSRPDHLAVASGSKKIADYIGERIEGIRLVDIPVWDAVIAFSVSDTGTTYPEDRSVSRAIFTVETTLTVS